MGQQQTKVIVTRKLPPRVEQRLRELFDVELNPSDDIFTKAQLRDAMQRADVLVPTLCDRIDQDLLSDPAATVKLLANYGAGVDHIDVDAARKANILVANSPTQSADDAADMAIALILSVLRRLKEGSNVMSMGDWQGWAPSAFLGSRMRGKTLGILGMGRIGAALAERANVFGLNIAYHSRNPIHPDAEQRLKARYYGHLETMLPTVDILAICAPLTQHTHDIINHQTLALLKPNSFLVNVSRGGLIDESALIAALQSGQLAGAGLDVLATTAHVNQDLADMPNVMLLPHMGSATAEAREEMGATVIRNIKMFEDGHNPPNLVLPNL